VQGAPLPPRIHGGPDAAGPAAHDFSTNANACGPCPPALAAVHRADPSRYPDPAYTALRERLAAWHGVALARIVLAASASECIMRITAACATPGAAVQVPAHAYGDYAWAARAHGLAVHAEPAPVNAALVWACEPSSPLGQAHAGLAAQVDALRPGQVMVLDCAYAPLRLQGQPTLDPARCARVWQLWSPNKVLGLTGVRAAYAIAPLDAHAPRADTPTWADARADAEPPRQPLLERLAQRAPSWPLGAHGVALLQAWTDADTQAWLAGSLPRLREWKARQQALCESLGWLVLPSETNFFCAQVADAAALPGHLQRLRARGVQLRDCASFGLPGHVRLAVLAPAAQDALARAWASG
jgi:histidinol-phosphate aminotransferase